MSRRPNMDDLACCRVINMANQCGKVLLQNWYESVDVVINMAPTITSHLGFENMENREKGAFWIFPKLAESKKKNLDIWIGGYLLRVDCYHYGTRCHGLVTQQQ